MRVLNDERLQVGRAAATRGSHGGNRERDIRPILAGVLRDLGTAHQLERGLAVFRASVEAGVVERHPACVAHGISYAQRRLGRGRGRKLDPDFQSARQLLRPVLFETRDFDRKWTYEERTLLGRLSDLICGARGANLPIAAEDRPASDRPAGRVWSVFRRSG